MNTDPNNKPVVPIGGAGTENTQPTTGSDQQVRSVSRPYIATYNAPAGAVPTNSQTSAAPAIPIQRPVTSAPKPQPNDPRISWFNHKWFRYLILALVAVLLLLVGWYAANTYLFSRRPDNGNVASKFTNIELPLDQVANSDGTALLGTRSLVINGPLRANSSFVISPSGQPSNATPGQIYYDQTSDQLSYFNGSEFVTLGSDLDLGNGLVNNNGTLVNNGVLTLQGQTGDVNLAGGSGITIDGTTISNSGIVSVIAGSGITVNNDGAGNVTISSAGGGGNVNGSGTVGRIAKFTGVQTVGDSLLSESGSLVTVTGDLAVTNLTANGVLVGNGAGAITSVVAGGSGQCLLSTVGAPTWGACSGGSGVTTLNGLSGALTIANASAGGSTITIDNASTSQKGIAQFNSTNFTAASGTINTIQDIATSSSPTFNGLTLSGDLAVNGGDITSTGQLTIASGGAGNDVIVNGADQFIVQDAAVFNALSTFTAGVAATLADTENVSITNTVTGTNSVDLLSAVLTNSSTGGTQRIALLQNAAGTGTTESLLTLDNADTDTAVTAAIQFINGGGGFTNLFNVEGTLISNGEFTVLDGGISLGTETNGDYVASFTAGTGLSGDAAGEGSTPTLSVNTASGVTTSGDNVILDVNYNPTWTADHTWTLSGTENLDVTHDLGATVNMIGLVGTPSASAGTTRGIFLQQASSANTNGLDQAITIDNADPDLPITTALSFLNTGGGTGYTNIMDIMGTTLSATELTVLDSGIDESEVTGEIEAVTAGGGLTGGGAAGSVTLDIVSGNGGIVVNTNDITLTLTTALDALSSTTSSSSGLEVVASGLTLLQGCGNNELLKWNETSDVWACASDSTGTAVNSFETISTPSGTSPVADSGTDTLTLSATGSNLTITGNAGADSITLNIDESVLAGTGISNSGDALNINVASGITTSGDNVILDVNYNPTWTADHTWTLSGTENLDVTHDLGGTVNMIGLVGTPSATTGTTRGIFLQQADSANTNGLDEGIAIDNADADLAIPVALKFTNTGGGPGFTNILDILGTQLSASELTVLDGGIDESEVTGEIESVTAGGGLTGGGAAGSVTLDIVSGNGALVVNTNDITLTLTTAVDDLSSTTSSSSGLEVVTSGLTLLQGCSNNEILKWNETSDVWACASDSTGGTINSFETISTPAGTSPVADSSTDTLTLSATGSNLTITGNAGTDTITLDISESTLAGNGLSASGDALQVNTANGLQITSDNVEVNQDFAFTWTADHTWNLLATENLEVTSNLAGSVDMLSLVGTPSATSGTTRGIFIQQAASANTNGLDSGIVIDNADTDLALTTAIEITNSGGFATGITKGIDLNTTGIVTDIELQNAEQIDNNTDDNIVFTGTGGTNNESFTIDLDSNASSGATLSSGGAFVLINDNLSVGIDGDTTENISFAGFSFSGNDLYVDDSLGVNGDAYLDGTLSVASTINSQTISSAANFTGTVTVQGANSLTLGTASTNTGAILFKGSGSANTLTLTGPTSPSTATLTLPNETGTLCSTGSVCSGYQAAGSYANTALSNLASVAINAALGFQSNQTADINFNGAASAAGNALNITGQTAGATGNNGGAITIQGGTATTTGSGGTLSLLGGLSTGNASSTNGGVTIDTGNVAGSLAGTINIGNSNFSHNINIGSTGTGASTINIGMGAASNTISIGSNSSSGTITVGESRGQIVLNRTGQSVSINAGTSGNADGTITIGSTGTQTGTINLGTGTSAMTINLGTGANAAKTVTLGSTISTSTTTIQAGTGGINIGTGGIANTIQIGTTTGAVAQTINIGNNATASSTSTLVIGSTIAGTTTLQSQGGVAISTLGSADSVTYLCRNSSNIVSTCQTGATGTAFIQGGNSFSGTAILGTNDSNSLTFETNNATQVTIAVGGAATFQNSANSTSAFRVLDSAGTAAVLGVNTTNQRVGINTSSASSAFQVNQSNLAPGTVTNSASSANVTGSSTTFTSTFQPGDTFTITSSGNTCTVQNITSDTALVCTATLAGSSSGSTYSFTQQNRFNVADSGKTTVAGVAYVTNPGNGRLFSIKDNPTANTLEFSSNVAGSPNLGTNTDSNADTIDAAQFNSGTGGTVSRVCVYFATVNASNHYKVAIYDDSSNSPNNLVSSATAPSTVAVADSWNCASLGGTYTLTPNTNYWLAVTTESGGTTFGTVPNTTFNSAYVALTWGTNFPGTFTETSTANDRIAIYTPYDTITDQSRSVAGISLSENNTLALRPKVDTDAAFAIYNSTGSIQMLNVNTSTHTVSVYNNLSVDDISAPDPDNVSFEVRAGGTGKNAFHFQSAANSTVAVGRIQLGSTPAGGASLLTFEDSSANVLAKFDSSGVLVLGRSGAGSQVGKVTFNNTTNSNTASIQSGATGTSYTLTLPTALPGSTQCLQSSNTGTMSFTSCGGATDLQTAYDNSTSPATISLTTTDDGIVFTNPDTAGQDDTYVLTINQLEDDTGTHGGLSIQSAGTGNLLLVTDTTSTAADVLTIADGGAVNFHNQTNSTAAFNIENSTGGNLFTVNTTGSEVGINLGGANTPNMGTGGLLVNGVVRLQGSGMDSYTTPLGGTIGAKFSVENFDLGPFAQYIALGLESTADSTARVITLLDERSSGHQPTLAVLSPDQNQVGGFSWDGSNTDFKVLNLNSSGTITLGVGAAGTTLQVSSTGVDVNGFLDVDSDVDYHFAGSENFNTASTITGTTAVNVFNLDLTNQTSSGNQNGLVINNVNDAANATTESLLTLSNSETTANTVTDYLLITSSATDTTADAIDVSDGDLFNAINVGANNIAGTTAVIDFTNFDVSGTGAITLVGGLTPDITTQSNNTLTVQPGGTGALVLTSANTGTAAIDINVTGTGGDLDIDVNDAITVDAATITMTLAAGTTDFTIGGLDSDSNLILTGLAGANAVLYASPTTGVVATATTTSGSLCLLSAAGASGTPSWGSCSGSGVTWDNIGDPAGDGAINFASTEQTMDWTDFTTTALDGMTFNFDNNGGTAGTDSGIIINNAVSTNSTGDVNTEALLLIQQLDTTASGTTVVDNGIKIDVAANSGMTDGIEITNSGGNITNGLNLADTGGGTFTNGISLSGTFTSGINFGSSTTTADVRKDTTSFVLDMNNASDSTFTIANNGAGISFISNPQNSNGGTGEAFGAGASVGTTLNSVAIGNSTTTTGDDSVVIGFNTDGTSSDSVLIGNTASCSSNGCVVIGADSVSAGLGSVAVGYSANATGGSSIALGANAQAPGDNQFVAGSDGDEILNVYFGSGVEDATPSAFTIHGTGVPTGTTDTAGASLTLAGGTGTGTGNGGSLNFQIAKPGTTGSSVNSLTTIMSISGSTGTVSTTNTATSTNSLDVSTLTLTNQTSSGTQRGLVITNANDAANATTEALATIDNAETTANTVTDYLLITSSATDTTADAIDVSDSDLFNAINVGANNIAGTTAVIDFTNFDVAGTGAMTLVGGLSPDITTQSNNTLTVQPGGTGALVLTSTNTGTAAIDINVTGSGGDLDIDVNDAITVDAATITMTLAAGTTDFTIGGLDSDSNLILTGLAGANAVLYASPTTGVVATATTTSGSQCLVSTAGASGTPSWGSCASGVTWDVIGDPAGNGSINFGTTEQTMDWTDFTTTDHDGMTFNFDNNGGTAGTDNGIIINNAVSTNTTGDLNTESLLLIQQLDTTASGTTVVDNAIKIDVAANSGMTDGIEITNSGGNLTNGINIADTAGGTITTGITFSGTLTTGIDLSGASTTTDLILDDGLTIAQTADNSLDIVEGGLTLNYAFASSTITQSSASKLAFTSTNGSADGVVITSTGGGIDITTTGAAAGEDIDVTSSASVNIIGQEAAADAVVISASTNLGGVRIQAGDNLATAVGDTNDIELRAEDDVIVSLTGPGAFWIDAATTDSTINNAAWGAMMMNVDAAVAAAGSHNGFYLDYQVVGDANTDQTNRAMRIDFTNSEDSGDDLVAFQITNINDAANGTTDALVSLSNAEGTANTVTDYLLITAATTDTTADAIDVSDSDLFNAINVGSNNIAGTTAVIDFTNFDVSGTGAMTLVGGLTPDITTQSNNTLTVQPGGTGALVLTSTNTGTAAIDINVTGSGGDLDIDVNDAITVDAATITMTLAAGTTDFTIGGLDADSNLILTGLAGANAVLYASPTTGVVATATTTSGSQCLVSTAGASGTPSWGSCSGSVTWDNIGDPGGNGAINFASTEQTMDWTDFTTTDHDGMTFNFDNNGGTAGTDNGIIINNAVSTNAAGDLNTETLLLIQQLDTTASGTTVVDNGIKIDVAANSGMTDGIEITNSAGNLTNGINIADTAGGTLTTGINLSGTLTTGVVMGATTTTAIDLSSGTSTTDLILDDGLTIAQTADNSLDIVEGGLTLNYAFASSTITQSSASKLAFTSSNGSADGVVITSTNGGIDIATTGSAAGEDIDITAGSSSVNISASESAANDAIKFVASAADSTIFFDAGTTDKTADAVRFDVDVNSANVDGLYIDLDVGTAMSAAEVANGINIDVTGLAGDSGTSIINGITLNGDVASGGVVSGLKLTGSFDNGIYFGSATNTADIRKDTTSFTIDLNNASGTTLTITNAGAGVSHISNTQEQTASEGFGAATSIGGSNSTAVGNTATVGSDGVAIGASAIASGAGTIAIGKNANAGSNTDVILIGADSSASASHQAVFGGGTGTSSYINDVYFGAGVTDGSASSTLGTLVINATGGSGLNNAGAALTLAAGKGTGTGNGGNLNLAIAKPTTSSSTLNGLTTIMSISGSTGAVTTSNTITGTNSVDVSALNLTNQTSSGTQRGLVLTNVNDATNATTEALAIIDNAETTANLLTDYLLITSSATDTTTDAIDVSDSDLFNAINVGANNIAGTTAAIDFTNFDVSGTGTMTLVGGLSPDITTQSNNTLTVQPGGTGALVLTSTNTGTAAIDINVTGSGGDLDVDVNDAITIDAATITMTLAAGTTDFTIGGLDSDSNLILTGLAGANAVLYASPTTGVVATATTTSGSQCLVSTAGASGTPSWGACSGSGTTWDNIGDPGGNGAINFASTEQTMDWTDFTTTDLDGMTFNFDNNGGTAGTDSGIIINNAVSTNTTGDLNTENLLLIQQLDTTTTGTTVVDNALKIDSAGSSAITDGIEITNSAGNITNGINLVDTAGGTFATGINLSSGTFTTGIDMSGAATTTDLILDDGLTIAQTADNSLNIVEGGITLNADFGSATANTLTFDLGTRGSNAVGHSWSFIGGDAGSGGSPFDGGSFFFTGGNAAGTGASDGGSFTFLAGDGQGGGETGKFIFKAGGGSARNDFFHIRKNDNTEMLIIDGQANNLYLGGTCCDGTAYDITFSDDEGAQKSIGIEDSSTGDGAELKLVAGKSTAVGGTGGNLTLYAGDSSGASGTRTGGSVGIEAGAGTTANGVINIGTTNSANINIGKNTGSAAVLIDSGSGNLTLASQGSSTTGIIHIGAGGAGSATPDYFALDVKSTTGDPVAAGAEGYMYYNTFDNKFRCYQGSAWTDCIGSGGSAALDTLTAATTDDAALTSGDNTIEWNWALTSATSKAFTIGENSASTGGSGDQHILRIDTASGSTAGPLEIVSNSADSGDIEFNLASSGDFEIQDNGTAFATFADTGAVTFAPTTGEDVTMNFAGNGRLDLNPVTYEDGFGALDLRRSGNFTGSSSETATDFLIFPGLTLTEPGTGNFTYNLAHINSNSIAVTAAAGTSEVNNLKITTTSDADIATIRGIYILGTSATAATQYGIEIGSNWDQAILANGKVSLAAAAGTQQLYVYPGIATSGVGTDGIRVDGGGGFTAQKGGNNFIYGGSGGAANIGSNGGAGGDVTIGGGTGGADSSSNAAGTGGAVAIAGGNGGTGSNFGGGSGGLVTISGGVGASSAGGNAGSGGGVTIDGSDGNFSTVANGGNGGTITIGAGDGGNGSGGSSVGGNGGDLNLSAGTGNSGVLGDGNGGSITLTAGAKGGSSGFSGSINAVIQTDLTNGFRVTSASETYFGVSGLGNAVKIGNSTGTGSSTTVFILDSAASSNPTAVAGGMYYLTGTGFRCSDGATWTSCGGGTTPDLNTAYNAGAAGTQTITQDSGQDGIVINNPNSGSDDTYILTLDQDATTGTHGGLNIDLAASVAGVGLNINSAGTGNLLKVTDATATAADVFTIADTGVATFKAQTDNATQFSIKDSSGMKILGIDTTADNTNNSVSSNPSFEVDTSGWAAKGTTPTTFARDTTQFYNGVASLKVTTQATANQGIKFNVTLTDSTSYSMSFYVKLDSASTAMATMAAGYSSDGSTDNTACTLNTSTISPFGWTKVTCNFTTPASHSGTPFIYVKQTDAVIHTWYTDAFLLQTDTNTQATYRDATVQVGGIINTPVVLKPATDSTNTFNVRNAADSSIFNIDTVDSNIISNPGFETNVANWTAVGTGASIARDTSQSWMGAASMAITTGTAADNGAKFVTGNTNPTQLATSSTYIISWYARITTGSFTDLIAAYDVDGTGAGADTNCTGINTQTVSTSGWTRYSCTITTTGTAPASTAFVIIKQDTSTSSRTLYVDGVQLELTSLTPYSASNVFINGVVTTPMAFKNQSNSTDAFTVMNASNTNLFNVDTLNSKIVLGTTSNGFTFDPASGPLYTGTARPVKRITLVPEYPGGTLSNDADGSNTGTMTSDFCSGSSARNINQTICDDTTTTEHSYYTWTTASANDYDIWIRYQVPSDFSAFNGDTSINMYGWRSASTATTEVQLAMFQAGGTQCGSTTNVATSNNNWTETALTGTETSCSVSPGDVITFRITMESNNATVRAGEIRFDYYSKF